MDISQNSMKKEMENPIETNSLMKYENKFREGIKCG